MLRLDLIIRSLFRKYKIARSVFSDNEILVRKELEWYSGLISQHFEYFNELSTPHKQRFLRRVHSFKRGKEFHYVELEISPQIPVLVSTAAVQITVGLRKYKMSFFNDIYIMADAYTYGFSQHPWIGHVNRKGIFISWKHFLQRYSDNTDMNNVGLHEMAHALVYANFREDFMRNSILLSILKGIRQKQTS
ncbi:MAG: zinc-dependent peptidase [Chitinophagaceae bacterium]|nr:zinc-dependent peptidase [Chitinophagaceae bacterium]